jgi:hypothetical protein
MTSPGAVGAIFDQNPEPISRLLQDVEDGRLALPNFQRDFVWEPERTEKLLSSVMARYPAGVLLFWTQSAGGIDKRNFAGAPGETNPQIFRLVLDGQQRVTSLYRAIKDKAEETYFVNLFEFVDSDTYDVRDELDIDWDRTVVSRERTLRERRLGLEPDYRSLEWQLKNWYFPIGRLGAPGGGFDEWLDDLLDTLPRAVDKQLAKKASRHVRDRYVLQLLQYQFPTITLSQETSLLAVCRIFETINSTGVYLGPFELLTAKFFPSGINLRTLWDEARDQYGVLVDYGIDPYAVMQALTLRAAGSAQRSDVLNRLTAGHVTEHWQSVIYGFKRSLELLRDDCGVKTKDLLPYGMVLVPMAAVWDVVENLTPAPAQIAARSKLRRYFWCTVFTGNFDQGANSQAQADFGTLRRWLGTGPNDNTDAADIPEAVAVLPVAAETLLTATTKKKALFRRLMALLIQQGAKDFHDGEELTSTRIRERKIDSHHVFPKRWLQDQAGGNPELILNRTPINAATNRRIGAKAPSAYIAEIQAEVEDGDLTGVLASHLIDVNCLVDDDYEGFIRARLDTVMKALEDVIAPTPVIPLRDEEDLASATHV